ncbi:MAG: energy transducer TonB [Gammaproteobacteria bacterium]|nr:MAG: energy transducer TonB [Gammaproteobacteria bacterium]
MPALASRPFPLLPPTLRTALVVSIGLHVALVAWLRPARIELPQPFAVEHLEVSFAAAPAPRATKTPTAPSSTATRKPTPAESAATSTPAENPAGAGRDEPLVEAKFDVATLHNPKPPYPLAARRRGYEGRVLLSVLVRADGACGDVTLKQSSGHTLLDSSALDTVKRWRFLPARRGATSVESRVDVPITFRLENAG